MPSTAKQIIQMTLLCSVVILSVAVGSVFGQTSNRPPTYSQPASPTQNPLLEEMTTHDKAFGIIVTAVAIGDSEKVHSAIETMRSSIEKTRTGVQAGTVTLPKNAPRFKDFLEMEQKFQNKLDALDRAALHHNQREMLRITNMLLSACVKCHQMFRK